MERYVKWATVPILLLSLGWMVWAQTSKPSSPASQPGVPKLLELGNTTCVFCQQMKPMLEELRKQCGGKLTIEIVDLDKNAEMKAKYPVEIVPVQIFFDPAGKELFRHTGAFPRDDILKKWKELGYDFGLTGQATTTNAIKIGGG